MDDIRPDNERVTSKKRSRTTMSYDMRRRIDGGDEVTALDNSGRAAKYYRPQTPSKSKPSDENPSGIYKRSWST